MTAMQEPARNIELAAVGEPLTDSELRPQILGKEEARGWMGSDLSHLPSKQGRRNRQWGRRAEEEGEGRRGGARRCVCCNGVEQEKPRERACCEPVETSRG